MGFKKSGFTLLELLVVITIIGILATIAIAVFDQYKKRGFDSRAQSDLANIRTTIEAFYVDNDTYNGISCSHDDVGGGDCLTILASYGIEISDKVSVSVGGFGDSYSMATSATDTTVPPGCNYGSGVAYSFDSSDGVIVEVDTSSAPSC